MERIIRLIREKIEFHEGHFYKLLDKSQKKKKVRGYPFRTPSCMRFIPNLDFVLEENHGLQTM